MNRTERIKRFRLYAKRITGFFPIHTCTEITLRMYANRKGWNLTDVKVELRFEINSVENKFKIVRDIQLLGNLDENQKARLLIIANKCPIHKILTNPIEITTALN
jgi:putative redox protein